jgi:Xaa-Pro aminopeptidase
MTELSSHWHVQDIALRVLRDVVPFIKKGHTEREVVDVCTQLLKQYGVTTGFPTITAGLIVMRS